MKTFKKQAAKKLFKKLSALRATLSNEERAILDNIVGVEEVAAHKMNTKLTTKASPKIASKASEVAAHKMNTKISSKASPKITSKASEVAAHKMNPRSRARHLKLLLTK